ncbi:MAG: metallophosphoesterase [Sphingomonas sp.]|uniref:metallophosphoesterase n=1 Tax=Sphingomonas sp. TaxID=28214 RepID=UPI00180207B1|nr:metallophosphoesterase [Sphingomonas sp.]MBA3667627.1 metallophosphoesterase [Sphingomonas sp.]
MPSKLWPIVLLFAALFPGAARAHAPAHPPSPPPRIIAIGDLHGDHDAWIAIARAAGAVDGKGHWAGGRAVLVQVGDIVDRGPASLAIIHDLMRIEKEARRRGGRVVVLIGNHEAMNMIGDLRYVHPGEYAAFADSGSERRRSQLYVAQRVAIEAAARTRDPSVSPAAAKDEWLKATPLGKIEHRLAWRPDGPLGRWTLGHAAVVKIGDSLFVHGGLSSAFANLTIEEINRRVAVALNARDEAPTAIINDPMGPLWYRGLVTRDDPDALPPPTGAPPRPTIAQEVDQMITAYGVKRIVVGHTPSRAGIIADLGGKLWRIDSANSSYYGGPPSYLEITGDRVTTHKVPRPPEASKGGK